MKRVLFVCTGNICRSPTAEGVFTRLVVEAGLAHLIEADSAGTHEYHIGEPPDRRSQSAARRRGVDISGLRARRVERADFDDFDYVVAMDRGHVGALNAECPARRRHVVKLFLRDFAPHLGVQDVPDPYYGGPQGFEYVLDVIEAAAAGLLAEIQASLAAEADARADGR